MLAIFILWLLGTIAAFIGYNMAGEGKLNYDQYHDRYTREWKAEYTLGQQVSYAITWPIWFVRWLIRIIRDVAIGFLSLMVDFFDNLIEKWKKE